MAIVNLKASEPGQGAYRRSALLAGRRLTWLPLTGVIFFVVSGGAYGLESLVGSMNPGWAMLLIVFTPLFWALPICLMVAELSSAMPEEGGYYVWVRTGLGDFWGFQEGWWSLCYSAVDMAIYPVLFIDYLAYFFPTLGLPAPGPPSWRVLVCRWIIAVAVIATAYAANWRGIQVVGKTSLTAVMCVLAPFTILCTLAFWRHGAIFSALSVVRSGLANSGRAPLLAVGVSTVLWNYCGWDNVSTFAAEVKEASRSYPLALGTAQLVILLSYAIPVLAGISASTSAAVWNESAGWPAIARLVGGPWFGTVFAAVALLSAWSMYNSQLLYASRLPYAMARDGWLPSPLTRVSKRTAMPSTALLAACSLSAVFAVFPFTKLVVIDILLYSAGLFLEFMALAVLRKKRPEMSRPFRIRGGWPALCLVIICPMSFALIVTLATIAGEGGNSWQLLLSAGLMLAGILLYRRKRGAREKSKELLGRNQRRVETD